MEWNDSESRQNGDSEIGKRIDEGLQITARKNEYPNIQLVIYNAAKELLIECKLGGGLILGCSNAVVAETPADNYLAVLDAWREYGS